MFSFTITHKDTASKARLGVITTQHGSITTPAFIPVATKATIKGLSIKQLEEIGFESVLSNTYHLYLRPGSKTVKKMGGLQKFMGWHKPMFTDSGGFQVFSLNGELCKVDDDKVTFRSHIDASVHEFTAEKSMQIQQELGADMIFAFDQCLDIQADYETTKKSLARTHAWERRSLAEFQRLNTDQKQALFGIVQGGRFKDLREESAKFVASLPFDGIGIGSIFGDPKEESCALVEHALKFLPEEKPKHLLGIGSVDDIFMYVPLGIDTFDCVLPTRLARVGYVFIRPESGGNVENKFRYRITNAQFREDARGLDDYCDCWVCKEHTRAYVHHLFRADELLAYTLVTYHNLYFFFGLMKEIREAIAASRFEELRVRWILL